MDVLRLSAALVACLVGVGCADGDAPPISDPVSQQPFSAVLSPGPVGVVNDEESPSQAQTESEPAAAEQVVEPSDSNGDQQMLPPP